MFYSNNINSKDWMDIIFAGRNKEYGAYQLRQYSSKAINIALVAVLCTVGGICCISFVNKEDVKTANNFIPISEKVYEVIIDDSEIIEPLVRQELGEEMNVQVAQDISAKDLVKFTEINPTAASHSDEEIATVGEILDKNVLLASINMKGQNGGEMITKGTFGKEKRDGGISGSRIGDPNGTSDKNTVFEAVEVFPEPIEGMTAFVEWVAKNYKFSDNAVRNEANGLVQVSFVVEKDGSLSTFVVNKDIGFGTGDEAIRLLKKAKKWHPGVQNGVPVRVSFTLPIRLSTTPQ